MIYFVRHGQTDADKQKRFNGGIDLDLNEIGIAEAKQQAEKLSGIKFDYIFCSPKKRAVQTCEILASSTKYEIDNRLSELSCGKFDGKKRTIISLLRFLRSFNKGKNGVEQRDLFTARNIDFCETVLTQLKGKSILIISHNGNAVAFDYYFKGKPKGYSFSKRIVDNGRLLTFDC